jgi:hypothetical protein
VPEPPVASLASQERPPPHAEPPASFRGPASLEPASPESGNGPPSLSPASESRLPASALASAAPPALGAPELCPFGLPLVEPPEPVLSVDPEPVRDPKAAGAPSRAPSAPRYRSRPSHRHRRSWNRTRQPTQSLRPRRRTRRPHGRTMRDARTAPGDPWPKGRRRETDSCTMLSLTARRRGRGDGHPINRSPGSPSRARSRSRRIRTKRPCIGPWSY